MKKHILFTVLAALMVFALTACNNTTAEPTPTYPALEKVAAAEPAKNADGAYVMTEPGHVAYMAEHPDQKYVLGGDIDMGGAGWTPIADFSGSLNGQINDEFNYTISNLTIQVPEGATNAGFFGVVSGDVKHIIFKDVTVVSIYNFSGNLGVAIGESQSALNDVVIKNCSITATVANANVGAVAGKVGKADACYSTGTMNITLNGGTCYVGGTYGYATKATAQSDARVEMNITAAASTSGATGGTLGYAGGKVKSQNFGGKLNVRVDSAHAVGTLIGELNHTLENSQNCAQIHNVTGATQANIYCGIIGANGKVEDCVTRDPASLEINIPAAELARRQDVVDYMYQMCSVRWIPSKTLILDEDDPDIKQVYYAGEIYFGMPYSDKASSWERFLSNLNPDGTIKDTVGEEDWDTMLANDCADSMYWAWSRISADVCYTLTKYCICENGIIPVGSYAYENIPLAGEKITTTDICAANGAQVLYEAYAQLKLGDGVLYAPGHIRMLAENAYVFRDENGQIDPERSYIVTHDQGAGRGVKQQTRHTTCNINKKYTFAQLFRTNYIPITIAALTEGADPVEVTTSNTALDQTGVAAGTITCSHRINYVTMQIKDASGQVAAESTVFPTGVNEHNTTYDLTQFQSVVADANLIAGNTYTYTILVYAGTEEVVVQTFSFQA